MANRETERPPIVTSEWGVLIGFERHGIAMDSLKAVIGLLDDFYSLSYQSHGKRCFGDQRSFAPLAGPAVVYSTGPL